MNDSPFSLFTLWEERESYLTPTAGTPEGRLLCAVVEHSFAQTGAELRKIKKHIRKGKTGPKERVGSGGESLETTKQRLHEVQRWISSDRTTPFSLRWIAAYVAYDPEAFVMRVREAYCEVLEYGDYEGTRKGNTVTERNKT
jgi:hypothetical protein